MLNFHCIKSSWESKDRYFEKQIICEIYYITHDKTCIYSGVHIFMDDI